MGTINYVGQPVSEDVVRIEIPLSNTERVIIVRSIKEVDKARGPLCEDNVIRIRTFNNNVA